MGQCSSVRQVDTDLGYYDGTPIRCKLRRLHSGNHSCEYWDWELGFWDRFLRSILGTRKEK